MTVAPIDPFDFYVYWPDITSIPWSNSTLTLITPPNTLVISSPSGKTLTLSWEGDIVTISGDLPATDAAKIALDAFGIEAIKRQGCK